MTSSPRLATFSVAGSTRYGAVNRRRHRRSLGPVAKDYPTLREVAAAGALTKLAEEAAKHSPDFALDTSLGCRRFRAGKIICIGVNYPDRNAEYKDGQDARNIRACSCGRRARSSATTRRWFARARRRSSITRRTGSDRRQGRPAHPESAALDHIARSRCAMKAPSATGPARRNSM